MKMWCLLNRNPANRWREYDRCGVASSWPMSQKYFWGNSCAVFPLTKSTWFVLKSLCCAFRLVCSLGFSQLQWCSHLPCPSLAITCFIPRLLSAKLQREGTMASRIRERLFGSVTSRFHFEHPRQCPEGHRQISWVSSENNVHCWLCDKAYPISDCSAPHGESPQPASN